MKPSLLTPFSISLIAKIFCFLITAVTPQTIELNYYLDCNKTYACGSIYDIKYPFWGSDRPSHCGLQGYEITCTGFELLFNMSLQSFVVRSIKRSPYIMNIVREDLSENICSTKFVDTTIDFKLVNYSSSAENLTLFYSCPSDVLDSVEPNEKFKCGGNNSVIASLKDTVWYEARQKCEKNITTSVMHDKWERFSIGNLGLVELITEGFELDYETQANMQKCQNCEKSGGLCVTNTSTYEFICFCKDGSRKISCPGPGGFEVDYETQANMHKCQNCEKSGGLCGTNTSTYEFTCFCKDGSREFSCPGPGRHFMKLNIKIIGSSIIGALLSLIGVLCFYKILKKEITKRRKAKFFNENGGMLLQQQLSSGHGSVEKTKLFKSFELEKATNFYNVDRVLGQGGQGTVYRGVLPDGRLVAVKKSKVVDKSNIGHFINEIVILSQINHRNVVNLLGCCLETKVPLLVYELILNGTLFHHIHNPTEKFPLNWEVRLQIAVEIAQALSYLHSAASRPIYHRDIKSTNILLDENYSAKVSDFGISRLVDVGNTHLTTHVKGTFGYLDPEYFQTHHFNEKSDVYSFGVVLVELLTGQKPIISGPYQEAKGLASHFVESMEDNRLYEIIDPKLSKEDKIEEMVKVAHLAKACLNSKGKKRPTMKKVAIQLEGIRGSREQSMPRENDESNVVEEEYDDSSSSSGAWGENNPSLNVDMNSLLNS